MDICLSPVRIVRFLGYIVILLTVLSIAAQIYKFEFNNGQDIYITDLFNFSKEMNIPTFYSSSTLVFCGIILLIIGSAKKKLKDKHTNNWYLLGFIFIYLAIDEMLELHETAAVYLKSIFQSDSSLLQIWLLPTLIMSVLLSLWYLRFLLDLTKEYRNLFLLSGIVFVIGAAGLKVFSEKLIISIGEDNLLFGLITNTEELIEKTGILIFIYALLKYIKEQLIGLRLEIK